MLNKQSKTVILAIIFSVFAGSKFLFAALSPEQLKFLLLPTSFAVSLFTGTGFSESTGTYYFEKLNISINQSCSGHNFLLISFALTSALVVIRYSLKIRQFPFILPPIFFVSFILTIIVNSSRICLIVFINNNFGIGKNGIIHEAIGASVFLFFLISTYLISEKITRQQETTL